jgi:hypothetical protein
MTIQHKINNITFSDDTVTFIINEKEYFFLINDVSQKLKNATEFQRNMFVFSPSGYGIHWPLVDEDLSINGIIAKHAE